MTRAIATIGVAAALALSSGCESPRSATSVWVEVTSDLSVGTELRELRIQVLDRAGTQQLGERIIALTTQANQPAQYPLPASFALSPTDGSVHDCRLVVTGRGTLDSGSVVDLVESQAIAVFVQNEQARLRIRLSRSCVGQLCRDPMDSRNALTCLDGACASLAESALEDVEIEDAQKSELAP